MKDLITTMDSFIMKMIYIVLFILLLNWTTFSQVSAGVDREICPGEQTTIGSVGQSNYCYFWSPSTGLQNPNNPMTTAYPSETTVYTLTGIGPNFTTKMTDEVIVKIVRPEFEVISQNCCWLEGAPISLNQFTINPQEYISLISIEQSTIPTIGDRCKKKEQLEFKLLCGDYSQVNYVDIDIVNPDYMDSAPFGSSQESVPSQLGELAASKIESVLSRFKIFKKLFITVGCSPNITYSAGIQNTIKCECCNVGLSGCKAITSFQFDSNIEINFSMNCEAPTNWPPGTSLFFGAGGGGILSGSLSLSCQGYEGCLTYAPSINASVGFGTNSILRTFCLGAQGTGNLNITLPYFKYDGEKTSVQGPTCASLSLKADLKFFSFVNTGEINLYNSKQFCIK